MPIPRSRQPRRLALILAAVAAALLGGCHGVAKIPVTITGPEITRESRPAIDVRNWAGSVFIQADPTIKHASVTARAIPRRGGAPKGDDLERQTFVAAESKVEGGHSTLRVVSETRLGDPDLSEARLVIKVPSCGGIMVRNAAGPVEVRGAAGAITIENGAGNQAGGLVIVRTDQVITDPVTITTTNGKIHFQAAPGTSGQFDIQSDDGMAVMYALVGTLRVTSATADHFVGVLNNGENPVTIRTGKGTAEVYIIENAGSYRPVRR
ncbi:MAG: hypothetical protein IT437_00945 [Phycisphaerales bacterium]|nr:hypothetical protein [Phycisphaerales bacterium]